MQGGQMVEKTLHHSGNIPYENGWAAPSQE